MRLKKRLAGLLATILLIGNLSTAAFAATPADFSDFPNDWSKSALENAVENNLLAGSDGKINPNGLLTRAQLATILTRALGSSAQASLDNYSDVPKNAWYYDALSKAVAADFLSGSGNQMYPDRAATRQEVFVVLARILKLQDNPSGLSAFLDQNEVSEWAKGGVGALAAAGYIRGANGRINPNSPITRAEFAQVLTNVSRTYLSAPQDYSTDVDGNAIVNTANVSLKDMTIEGDLILADGIGTGDATLTNVKVQGRLVIRGGGSNSIRIVNSQVAGNVLLANPNGLTRVVLTDSSINTLSVYSDFVLNGNVENLVLADTVLLNLQAGTVRTLSIEERAASSSVTVSANATVDTAIVAAEGVTITGSGRVGTVQANADNVEVSVPKTVVVVGKNATGVTAGGTVLASGASATINNSGTGVVTAPTASGSSGGNHDYTNGFAGGRGTASNPWQIANANQLNRVRSYLSGYFVLAADIDLAASDYTNWTPIGAYEPNDAGAGDYRANPAVAFTGSFTGGGYTISNLTITRESLSVEDMSGTGLFGCIGGNGSVQNLTIENASVSSTGSCTGTLVGMAMSSNENAIKGITLSGTNSVNGSGSVAGLVGSAQDTNIIDCHASADVTMTAVGNGAGVLGGGVEGGVISGCSATGTVTATETVTYGGVTIGSIGVGGLMGCAFDSKEVINCTAENVTIRVGENASMVGGLLGYAGVVNEGLFASDPEGFTLIKGCEANNVSITAGTGAARIGGIVGSGFSGSNYVSYYPASSAIHIVDCEASGTIAADDGVIVGSILGYAFRNCAVVSSNGDNMIGATNQVGAADAAQAVSLDNVDSVQSLAEMLAQAVFDSSPEPGAGEFVLLTTGDDIDFADGDGTEANPWQIATAAQLNKVRNHLDGHFILTDNINLSEYTNWMPVGAYEPNDAGAGDYRANPALAFTGSFNGGGYTVSNLTITRESLSVEDMSGTGLFGCIGGNGSVRNLTIENASVSSTGSCTGALVGMAMSSHENAIKGITLSGTNSVNGSGSVAGLVGSAQDTNIIDCHASADVTMTAVGNGAGILGGGVEGGVISGCSATGTVTAAVYGDVTTGAIGVGGLLGCAFDSKEVIDCTAENVTIRVGENASMVGGLLGYAGVVNEGLFASDPEGFTLIKGCEANNVSITAGTGTSRIGGIVGSGFSGSNYNSYYPASSAIHIVDCEASGTIAADDGVIVGSILGYAFRNCAVVACDGDNMIGATNQVGAADAAQVVVLENIN